MKIIELYQTMKLFKGNEKLTFIGEFRPYKEDKCVKWFTQEWRELLDNYFVCNYYDYKLLPIDIDFIKQIIQSVFETNANKYNKMYGALYYYDFNPLWNVDGTEKTTTTYGENVNTTNYGATSSTNNLGESNGTNTTGSRSGESTEKVNGYNDLTDNLKTQNKNLWSSASASDSFHQDAVTNTASTSEHVDVNTNNEHTDLMIHERYGNIGVVSSVALLTEYTEFYANAKKNLIEVIANDIVSKICLGVL